MKPLLIGCGVIILLIFGVAVAAYYFLPGVIKKGWDAANEMIAAEEERQRLAIGWNAPADDAAPTDVFPETLDAYKRTSADNSNGIPALEIDKPGRHATYEAGTSRVDVYVFPLAPGERATFLNKLEKLNRGSGTTSWTKIDLGENYARAYLSSPALKQNYVWLTKSHVVVFRTEDSDDRDPLVKAFFQAGQTIAPAKPEPAPTPIEPGKDGAPKGGRNQLRPRGAEPKSSRLLVAATLVDF